MSLSNTKTVFSTKAEKYGKYRWDYAPEAVEEITKVAHLSSASVVADLGAGTGILTRHFAEKVKRVYAVEPNTEMRQILQKELSMHPTISVIDGSAEATTLPDESVDLVTVAQAIHWFDPEPARAEMRRILKKSSWLAVLRNYGRGELDHAASQLMTKEYGADFSHKKSKPKETPIQFYFERGSVQRMTYSFQFQQNWEGFMGALTSASFMPNEDNPLFGRLETEARKIFSHYSDNGNLDGNVSILGETELFIGQLSR